ncbi:hypothetical protein SG26_14295 [Haloarcula sp. CBA1115]|uniref:hypothetical protein n=1 Tax=unclassified Haloarcula TaxID=2624677 RepID=UPI0005955A92|nr:MULTISPECIES: hypothetical protein [unclassified Haloarcula]AJF26815.1 hypothetical protein SG26_14295 [Haloarcula sp. CBA1115]
MTETIRRVRDGWGSVDESLHTAADRLINSFAGAAVAGINLGFGFFFVLATARQSVSTSPAMTALAGLLSLSILLSGFMLAWGDDV